MKNVAKNEIVLHDPYSNALCPSLIHIAHFDHYFDQGAHQPQGGGRVGDFDDNQDFSAMQWLMVPMKMPWMVAMKTSVFPRSVPTFYSYYSVWNSDAQRLFFSQNVYLPSLNSTTRVAHVLFHCPYGFLANTFILIVPWVYLTKLWPLICFIFTFETKSSDRKAIWRMGGFPQFGEGDSEETLFDSPVRKYVQNACSWEHLAWSGDVFEWF